MGKLDRKIARMKEQKQHSGPQKPYGKQPPVAPNESDFAFHQWTGQGASDEFFKLRTQPAFEGLGKDAVLLPPHSLSISRTPQTGGAVIEAYPNGLAYVDQVGGMLAAALFGALLLSPAALMLLDGLVSMFNRFGNFHQQSYAVFVLVAVLLTIFLVIEYFLVRWDTTGYRYAPVLFDRAAGKVHVFADQTKLFCFWPLWGGGKYGIQTFDWACTRAQIQRFSVFTGNTAQVNATLGCVVTKASDNADVVAQFGVGSPASSLAVQLLLDRWEHIRRFMEHEGPLFVEGDGPYVPPATQSLLGALCWGQPLIGPGSKEWREPWNWGMFAAQLFTIWFLPLSMLFGLVSYAAFHIKSKPKWPTAIIASVGGDALTGAELDAWRNVIPSKPQALLTTAPLPENERLA